MNLVQLAGNQNYILNMKNLCKHLIKNIFICSEQRKIWSIIRIDQVDTSGTDNTETCEIYASYNNFIKILSFFFSFSLIEFIVSYCVTARRPNRLEFSWFSSTLG